MQPEPEQIASVVDGQYQNDNVPPAGTWTVWLTQLSPAGSVPDVPSSAEDVPLWAFAVLALGTGIPPADQYVRPLSKPLLNAAESAPDGVTAFDGGRWGRIAVRDWRP